MRVMTMDREREREGELESAMYTNCFLLGLDPDIIAAGRTNDSPRAGQFCRSNPKLGEQLLYLVLSSLRGPIQSSKDFDKVWPIFDSAQSKDFWNVVQGIISELESQGALSHNNLRGSLLAACCGPRFVELLWQLSLHALTEVHKRTFAVDVASNPLPAPLTDVAFSHTSSLLPVTKAKIALERRKFLENAETAVQRQASWSNLAHEMTAKFRGLCAEEAYLQQELENLHDLGNKVNLEVEHWDGLVYSSNQNAHMVQRATHLWHSLLSRKSQHEILASGPIEDLMAHREHRYRISGSSLLAAMEQSSLGPSSNLTPQNLDNEATEGSQADMKNESRTLLGCSLICGNEVKISQADEKNMSGQPTVDIAEVLRRWTHALQHIHKQSLQRVKAKDGEGPNLISREHDGCSSSHVESLAETLVEHRQHLNNIQVLRNQLKEFTPNIQNSISKLMDEINSLSSDIPSSVKHRSNSQIQAQSSGRVLESGTDDIVDMTSRLSSVHFEKVSASPSTLKLLPLFSSAPKSSGKGANLQNQQTVVQINLIETITEKKSLEQPPNNHVNNHHDGDTKFLQNLRRSVREAALSSQLCNLRSSQDSHSDDSSEHFFAPFTGIRFSRVGQYKKHDPLKSEQLLMSQTYSSSLQFDANHIHPARNYNGAAHMLNDLDSLDEYDGVNGFLSAVGSDSPVSDTYRSLTDIDDAQDQLFSPPLLIDEAIFTDSYEDLLAPLSDTETAFMEH